MIDSVLKGTGNSRFLKSAVPAGTSWADALAMLQAGTFPIDFNGINTEGFQQVGTPLNKANLLKDATAAQIGLPPSTTPDGMFQALGNTGELHVWRKTVVSASEKPAGYTLGAETTKTLGLTRNSDSSSWAITVELASSVSVDDAGNVTLVSPSKLSVYAYNAFADSFSGKFFRLYSIGSSVTESELANNDVYFVPSGNKLILRADASSSKFYLDLGMKLVTGYAKIPAGTTTTYPVSTNPNAYQEGDDAKEAGYTLGEVVMGSFLAGATNYTISYNYEAASELTVSDDGRTVSMTSPSTGSFGFMGGLEPGDDPAKIRAFMLGKFVRCTAKGDQLNEAPDTKYPFNTIPSDIVYIPSNAQITMANGDVLVDRYQPVTGYAAIPAGTTIEYLGKLGDKARVQVVSYVGTGTSGSDNPVSITFDFVPKSIWVIGQGYNYESEIHLMHGDASKNSGDVYYFAFSRISWESKTVSWYNTRSDGYQASALQANTLGETYKVLAIG